MTIPINAQIMTKLNAISRRVHNIRMEISAATMITIHVQMIADGVKGSTPIHTKRVVTFAMVATVIQPR